ncbi:MAG: carboxylesterase family protein, partial [Candidatus Binatia bacterium]
RNLFGVLPIIRDPTRYDATARHLSALWKATGADEPAAIARAARGPIVWVYRFDWDEEPRLFLVDVQRLLGAAHAFEIPFVFGHWHLGKQTSLFFRDESLPGREELSRKMISYWTEFARSGDPGRGRDRSLPRWEPFEPDPGRFLVFDTEAGGGVRMESGRATIDGVFAAVDRDPDLATQQEKCDAYRRLVEWGRGASRERYASLCADHPLPIAKID